MWGKVVSLQRELGKIPNKKRRKAVSLLQNWWYAPTRKEKK